MIVLPEEYEVEKTTWTHVEYSLEDAWLGGWDALRTRLDKWIDVLGKRHEDRLIRIADEIIAASKT